MRAKVLVFDSGVGGLSVYKEVLRQNPSIEPYYLFDNAFYPYGTKAEVQVTDRVCEVLSAFIKRYAPDLIVIACNTASTVALGPVRNLTSIPVVGVVPAIKPAAAKTLNGIIGLLATPATVGRAYTAELIKKYAADVEVLKIGSSRLVDLAEQKLAGKPCALNDIADVLRPWLELEKNKRPDTVILGCTHFPHLAPEIKAVWPEVNLVDSGEAIGRRVKSLLKLSDEVAPKVINLVSGKAFCTDLSRVNANLRTALGVFGFNSIEEFALGANSEHIVSRETL